MLRDVTGCVPCQQQALAAEAAREAARPEMDYVVLDAQGNQQELERFHELGAALKYIDKHGGWMQTAPREEKV